MTNVVHVPFIVSELADEEIDSVGGALGLAMAIGIVGLYLAGVTVGLQIGDMIYGG